MLRKRLGSDGSINTNAQAAKRLSSPRRSKGTIYVPVARCRYCCVAFVVVMLDTVSVVVAAVAGCCCNVVVVAVMLLL